MEEREMQFKRVLVWEAFFLTEIIVAKVKRGKAGL